ncbi:hypothetical protein P8Q88_07310 [Qipengyuania sp. XHP0207]|nr:hypothetical protein [Qipengyuania sp. XHP0207]MDG5747986.1 hypothetical protein [Qipengyuania sp. XHP0207]
MTEQTTDTTAGKREWVAPQLVRLGTIRDIAGPRGRGFQAGPNSRS